MPSPLLEAGIEQQACLGLYRFHEAVKSGNSVLPWEEEFNVDLNGDNIIG